MRSREVELLIKVKYSIEEDKYLDEAYGMGSDIDKLTVEAVKFYDGNPKYMSANELIASADHVEIVDDSWKLGPVIGTEASKVLPFPTGD